MSNNDFGHFSNPYHASAPTPMAPPQMVKPVSLTVFGIINIVWGLLALLGFVSTTVQLAFMSNQNNVRNPVTELMRTNSAYFGFMVATVAVGFIAAIALIVGGIGLLNGKAYGRTLSIGYCIYAIVFGLLGIVFNVMFMVEPMMQQMPPGTQRAPAMAGMIGVLIGGGICGLIYPAVLLIFMLRGPVTNYLRSQSR